MRFVLAGFLGGFVMFAWSAVSWMALPLHTASFNNFPTAESDGNLPREVSSISKLNLPKSGVYHYPGFPHHEDGTPPSDAEMQTVFKRMEEGPVISLMIYHEKGRDPFPPENFAIGFAVCVIASLIAAWMTWLAAPRLPGYRQRVMFVMALGAFVFFGFYAQSWLWWGYSLLFGVAETIDILVAPLLAGLVIAALIKPKPITN